jgi:hypothetical protein
MSVNTQKVNQVVNALNTKFENKQANKKTDISGDFSTDTTSYPTVKAVKDWTNDELDGVAQNIPTKTSDLSNDSGFITSSSLPTKTSDLTNDGDGTNPFLTQHQSLASKTVTVEKQATAESGYFATYVVKQNGSQVGSKINIPKDYLVKSGSVKTCTTANQPVSGYKVGDKYIDFVVNTKDSSGTDEHIYILVSDLVEDTTYTADGTTLQLSNANVFSIKEVPKNKLASGVQTSLGYADTFNSSPCKNITSTQISNWDSMAGSGVTISDVDSEIDAYLDAIVTALGN